MFIDNSVSITLGLLRIEQFESCHATASRLDDNGVVANH